MKTKMSAQLHALEARLGEIDDLDRAVALLEWDQQTQMPSGGAVARGEQLATLRRLSHDLLSSDDTLALLDRAMRETDGQDEDDRGRALCRVTRREVDRARRVPSELVGELSTHLAASYDAWTRARPAGDFASMAPYLEKTVELSRRWADLFPGAAHPADPAIDESDPGMTVEQVRALFLELRTELVPLVETLSSRAQPDTSFLRLRYDQDAQLAFGRSVVTRLGYDFSRGRSDLTHHPFMTKIGEGDVRITTRVRETDLTDSLYSTIHECGHALYEQSIDDSFARTPLHTGTSSGVHESQSRLWENVVGRSREFWQGMLPEARAFFPEQLGDVSVDEMHRAVNRVERSLIRVDADEVTYNLHVMIRFDLALSLLEGTLSVRDLPDAWNARYEADLGVSAPTPTDGVLQDVHWYVERVGGLFQGYTIGNVLSAQFYDAACRADRSIPEASNNGDFTPLLAWLVENVYRHGRVYDPNDLVRKATGSDIRIEPFVKYLKRKYGELYSVSLEAA
jgi:carboxypeptidase Taq